jgi:hypothetical protein
VRAQKLLTKGLIPEIQREDGRVFEASWAKRALLFLKV